MTPERARYIIAQKGPFGELRYSFRRNDSSETCTVHEDGITPQEDKAIRAAWREKPGHWTYYDTLCEIAASDGETHR